MPILAMKQAFVHCLDYEYLGLEMIGSVVRVNKNKNGKGHFIFRGGNDLVREV